jgi:hypothetical protein
MSVVKRVSRVIPFVMMAVMGSAAVIPMAFRSAFAEDSLKDADNPEAQQRKERYSAWMRKYAEETNIGLREQVASEVGKKTAVELVPNPVFRYSDEERFIPDATLWVWTAIHVRSRCRKWKGITTGVDKPGRSALRRSPKDC